MKKNNNVKAKAKAKKNSAKASATKTPRETPANPLGRKRDQALDVKVLEAAVDVLSEVGFDTMTMDQVATRAKAGKASLYRRWSSKAELVRDAVILMSKDSVELDKIPDTGSLRDDLFALHKPYSAKYSERKLKVLGGLGSFFAEHKQMAAEASAGIFDPLTELHQVLMKRAIERGEISKNADTVLASQVIIAMISYHSQILKQPFHPAQYATLLDHLIVPALKASR